MKTTKVVKKDLELINKFLEEQGWETAEFEGDFRVLAAGERERGYIRYGMGRWIHGGFVTWEIHYYKVEPEVFTLVIGCEDGSLALYTKLNDERLIISRM